MIARIWRRIRCFLNVSHRVTEKWWDEKTCGLGEGARAVWGCRTVDGKVNYFQCRDCGAIMPPWEVSRRGWSRG